ncbi:MAG: hypothetical protein JAY99_15935 [Candidatus Thiodiazotropha lotti]|nr:hypothetical protein [Candidatus Thiodiazotropha lotti]MCW4182660.1 hypothetical protein [Candidatus Thiodiazotropha weberae]MCG8001011.1 hypothetical protein [Candidatus Thiodiazotropha lotti]MCG8004360.1 hypothetical protein [Candidatus Thiodiazotropha lotti]MCW4187981.1 hypothetical protein [Candidatus Thiodiazotropha lotti]
MWNPFRKKPLLTEQDTRFQIECYRWLLTHFGGDDFYKEAQLVLPTGDYFPSIVDSNESAAQTTLKQVMKYAGMENWPVTLQVQEEDPNLRVAPTLTVQNVEQSPLGTFSVDENNQATITYNPKLTVDPTQMVATFAHELSHYLTGTAPEPPPGGWENWEFATDIGATFLGFGIFQANAAFNFRQHASVDAVGWQTSGGGYLTEAEHSYALAIFLRLKGLEPEIAFPHSDVNVKGYLKRALDELDRSNAIAELKEMAYVPRSL